MRSRNNTIELILVMILLIVITLSIFLLIEGGSNSYNSILKNKESFENARIASSYINLKIKQNTYKNNIYIKQNVVEGVEAIVINHCGVEEGLSTYIFYKNGVLYECYIDNSEIPSIDYSEEIVQVENLSFEAYKTDKGIVVNTSYLYNGEVKYFKNIITFRSN